VGRRAQGWLDKSGRWYARLGDEDPATGRKRAVMLRYPDGTPVAADDADGARKAVERIQRAGQDRARHGPTVAELCAAFVAWHDLNSAPRTAAVHDMALRRFARFGGPGGRYADQPAAAITPEHLWALDAAGVRWLRHIYMSVRACWRWGARPVKGRTPTRLLERNPIEGIQVPPPGPRVPKRLPWPEVRRLLRRAWGWSRRVERSRNPIYLMASRRVHVLALCLLARTGCRPGEAAALEWSELDLVGGWLRIPPEKTKTRRTGRARRFPIGPRMARQLAWLKAREWSHPRYVFRTIWDDADRVPRGDDLSTWLRGRLLPALPPGTVPEGFTLYWLRHTSHSRMLGRGVPIEIVAKYHGNSAKVIRETYHEADDAELRAAADALSPRRPGPEPVRGEGDGDSGDRRGGSRRGTGSKGRAGDGGG
jgi:integrase